MRVESFVPSVGGFVSSPGRSMSTTPRSFSTQLVCQPKTTLVQVEHDRDAVLSRNLISRKRLFRLVFKEFERHKSPVSFCRKHGDIVKLGERRDGRMELRSTR